MGKAEYGKGEGCRKKNKILKKKGSMEKGKVEGGKGYKKELQKEVKEDK
jgi:hypothetical protein